MLTLLTRMSDIVVSSIGTTSAGLHGEVLRATAPESKGSSLRLFPNSGSLREFVSEETGGQAILGPRYPVVVK